jgi:hypothetical protein
LRSRNGRVVYFVQSHRAPAQVARLVRTLKTGSPEARVVVGHDGRSCRLTRGDLPELPGVELFAVEGAVERGELSLLHPYFQAIDRLRSEGADYDWLVYLSGQDYPTQPLARSEARLAASERDGFLRFWEAFRPDNPWGRRRQGRFRYAFRYFRLAAGWAPWLKAFHRLSPLRPLVHVHLTYGPHLGLRRLSTPFRDGFVCYAGSQWTTLSRSAVELVAETVDRRRDLVDYYRRTICSDESLVQTILVNDGRFRLENDNLLYVDMAGSRTGSPRTLGVADLAELTSGRYHFARKFDPGFDSEVLDRLDEHVLGPASR